MRSPLFSLVVAVSLLAPLSAQRGEGGGRRGPAPAIELQHFEFREVEFPAASLTDGTGHYGVFLPKGFDDAANKDRSWPLVVWLHGFGGYGEFMARGGAKTLDELRGSGALPEVVFAVFQAPGGRRSRSVYVNGEQNGKVEDAIVTDLVAHVGKEFRAGATREQRAIMGISIGGFGALKMALKHADVFGAVAVHSAAIFPDDPKALPEQYARQIGRAMQMGLGEVFGDPIDAQKWASEMPMGLVRKAEKGAFANLRIYFDAGTEDHYGFAEPNAALHRLMETQAIAHTFRLVEGGGHAWSSDSMLDNLRQSLQFVGAALTAKPPVAPAGDKPGEKAGEKPAEPTAPGK